MPQNNVEELKAQLKKEQEKFENFFEINPYSISIYNAGGHFVRGNKAFFKLFKIAPPPDKNMFRDDPIMKKDPRIYKKMLELEKGQRIEIDDVRFNPHEIFPQPNVPDFTIWLHFSAFPVLDPQGKIINYVMMQQDITQRKIAEQKLHKKMEEMEKVIKLTVGRELKMKELKKENDRLQAENNDLKNKIKK